MPAFNVKEDHKIALFADQSCDVQIRLEEELGLMAVLDNEHLHTWVRFVHNALDQDPQLLLGK